MLDDFAPPVKGIIKALDAGIKLTKRVSRSASHGPENYLYISELAEELQRNMEKSRQAIADAYRDAVGSCGEDFAKALMEDESIQNRLKEVRIDLRDQIDECQDFDENLGSFQPSAFTTVRHQSKRCRTECTFIFNNLRDRIDQTDRHDFRMEDKSPPLSPVHIPIMEQIPRRKPIPGPSNSTTPPSLGLPFQFNRQIIENKVLASEAPKRSPKKDNPWTLSGPYFDVGPNTPPRGLSPEPSYQESLQPTPPSKYGYESPPTKQILIAKELVYQRLNANEEFLERRRQSRMSFHDELRKSVFSIEENRASESFSDGSMLTSPWSSYSSTSSPIERHSSRGSGYDDLIGRKRSQGQTSQGGSSRNGSLRDRDATPASSSTTKPENEVFSPASLKPPTPISATPMSPGISEYQPSESGTSMWMKSPVSPPMSDIHEQSSWDRLASTTATPIVTTPLAATLQVPIFGTGVEEGLEAVPVIESGLEVASSQDPEPVPIQAPNPIVENRSQSQLAMHRATPSMKSIDCPMRHDSSFYKFDGFCPGAKAMIRGETGFKVVKRPSGHYSATLSARCIKCAYEVGWNDVEKDRLLDRSGIYSNTGIRWRQRFISKCHLKTTSIDDAIYGCIFCIEDHRTVEDHDATIFFSVTSLFRHLARHPRPLPQVTGITTVYGIQPPSVLDFDIQFTIHEPKLSTYCMSEIASKVASRPSAHATITHHPKPTAKTFRDPDGQPTMHFADGAKIVGITFPERFSGNWCIGYHDGERGSFPANTISLLSPPRDEVKMNPQSSLQAVAKWDWKPKDKEEGWLKFSRGERIYNVGYAWQDQWCWSGCTAKGKWGLFPSSFVEDLMSTDSSSGNAKASKILGTDIEKKERGGLGAAFGFSGSKGRMVSFPLSRNRSSRGPQSPVQKEGDRERSGSSLSGFMGYGGHRRTASVRSNGSEASSPSSPLAGVQPGLEVAGGEGSLGLGGNGNGGRDSGMGNASGSGSGNRNRGGSGSGGAAGSSWLRSPSYTYPWISTEIGYWIIGLLVIGYSLLDGTLGMDGCAGERKDWFGMVWSGLVWSGLDLDLDWG
ncbi:hypothetical protein SBOR_5405 [Sclerotinia borealis F-4128]|uniref:SH3 domain-containing protein n=1 Tax=Sclerotinia borealis (strain F-4128) TaxID=1432307 RepID=W9CEB3_SCLBF|nr:hypothetical protein SBOR_5405 [Sclerotinia borealis F-4128]